MTLDKRELRDALGCFATGVTIVTSIGPKGELIGITANSFSSVSLNPPLVLFSLDRRAYSLKAFLSTQFFAINVLRSTQGDISTRFAKPLGDKWTGVHYESWETGCPILIDALANFDCKIRYTYDGGDHVIFVGEVLRMACDMEADPLIYFRGGYRYLRPPGRTED